jgi:hypothetical protein
MKKYEVLEIEDTFLLPAISFMKKLPGREKIYYFAVFILNKRYLFKFTKEKKF